MREEKPVPVWKELLWLLVQMVFVTVGVLASLVVYWLVTDWSGRQNPLRGWSDGMSTTPPVREPLR